VREAVVEDTCFTRPNHITLNNHTSIDRLEILQSCAHRSDDSDTIATLTNVWFQNERLRNFMLTQIRCRQSSRSVVVSPSTRNASAVNR
jgi:hypothetical protein